MRCEDFPRFRGKMVYFCLGCGKKWPGDKLLYVCPECGQVLLLENSNFEDFAKISGEEWRGIFDRRQSSRCPALRGIFRFFELVAPIFEEKDIIWLGEGNTPVIEATGRFRKELDTDFAFKNDGQNPSASFKDRGMACAFSHLKWLCRKNDWKEVLTVCASTGDTSAAAALYAAYVGPPLKSVVILPEGKVTSQQLGQPLGSGATVIELPGVFDDCMKVVEYLAAHYRVALLNSKNSWRILGQESYAFEIAQWFDWNMERLCLFVPIGNAGNISAIMAGCLKMLALGIINTLPRIFGVQSAHADPVFEYYSQPEGKRVWKPVQVRPSVAQAAMIGDPVSFPRVRYLAEKYLAKGGDFNVVQVTEQEIMDAMLQANRHGHISCTQGGECLAGMCKARNNGLMDRNEYAVLDSTAHAMKFSGFQDAYFSSSLPAAYEISSQSSLVNQPVKISGHLASLLDDRKEYAKQGGQAIASLLDLQPA